MADSVPALSGVSANTFIQALREVEAIRYSRLFSNTMIIYDYICTFDFEVELIWHSKWSPIKILFFVIRYYTLAASIFGTFGLFTSQLTNHVRTVFTRWEISMAFFSTMLAEGVLQTRIYALYGQNKGVLTAMVACYAIATAISAWAAITDIIQAKSDFISISGHVLCSFPTLSKNTFWLWLPPLIFESALCIMALYQGIQTFKYAGGRSRRVSLMDVLVRDSVMYFLIITVLYTTCFVMWMAAPVAYLEIPVGILVAMTCILGSRMIFNLRSAGVKQKQTFAPENGVPLMILERI